MYVANQKMQASAMRPSSSARSRARINPSNPSFRRGAVGVAFAVGVTAVLGMGALATEGGLWYMARRNAQSAADAGALSGAIVMGTRGNDTAGRAAGEQAAIAVVRRNSFASGVDGSTVTATAAGVRITVQVTQTQFMGLARLISSTPPVASAIAVAEIFDTGPACLLSLNGRTTITGSNITSASNCLLASNAIDTRSMEFGGNAEVAAYSVRTMGGCYGCPPGNTNVSLEEAPLTNALVPLSDPYRALQNDALFQIPSPGTAQGNQLPSGCQNPTNYTTTTTTGTGRNRVTTTNYTPRAWNASLPGQPFAICADIGPLSAGETLNLPSGTYLFHNASLKVTGGRVNCLGCTFVFSGTPNGTGQNRVGNMEVSSDSDVTLSAPTSNTAPQSIQSPLLEGIAIYRDYRANDIPSNPNNANAGDTIQIVGGANVNIVGAIYAPSSQVFYAGNSNSTGPINERCVSIVASTIQLGGNSDMNIRGCTALGTTIIQDRVARLVR